MCSPLSHAHTRSKVSSANSIASASMTWGGWREASNVCACRWDRARRKPAPNERRSPASTHVLMRGVSASETPPPPPLPPTLKVTLFSPRSLASCVPRSTCFCDSVMPAQRAARRAARARMGCRGEGRACARSTPHVPHPCMRVCSRPSFRLYPLSPALDRALTDDLGVRELRRQPPAAAAKPAADVEDALGAAAAAEAEHLLREPQLGGLEVRRPPALGALLLSVPRRANVCVSCAYVCIRRGRERVARAAAGRAGGRPRAPPVPGAADRVCPLLARSQYYARAC